MSRRELGARSWTGVLAAVAALALAGSALFDRPPDRFEVPTMQEQAPPCPPTSAEQRPAAVSIMQGSPRPAIVLVRACAGGELRLGLRSGDGGASFTIRDDGGNLWHLAVDQEEEIVVPLEPDGTLRIAWTGPRSGALGWIESTDFAPSH